MRDLRGTRSWLVSARRRAGVDGAGAPRTCRDEEPAVPGSGSTTTEGARSHRVSSLGPRTRARCPASRPSAVCTRLYSATRTLRARGPSRLPGWGVAALVRVLVAMIVVVAAGAEAEAGAGWPLPNTANASPNLNANLNANPNANPKNNASPNVIVCPAQPSKGSATFQEMGFHSQKLDNRQCIM